MPAGRRRSRSTGTSRSRRSVVKKPAPLGTDSALTLRGGHRPQGGPGDCVELSYWDLWFALVAEADFDGDWERLRQRFREDRAKLFSRESAERKLSHVRDLHQRLQQAGVGMADILRHADPSPGELRRARNRVLKRELREREWSEAMRHTPKQRWSAHALRGFWPLFPVSPQEHADRLGAQFQTRGWFSAEQSFGIERKLDKFLDSVDRTLNKRRHAEAQAMLRAFLTVVIELMEVADDSYGCIGDTFQRGFTKYLDLPCDRTSIEEQVFFHDLLTLLIWEDYGLTYEQTDGYFERIAPDEGDLCIDYLRRQIEELRADDLDYQFDEALTLLGQVIAEQNRFELFEDLAQEMGTRHWKRIIVLADRAIRKRKRKLAEAVFDAALGPGMHEGLLKKKYEQLKQGKWDPDPRR